MQSGAVAPGGEDDDVLRQARRQLAGYRARKRLLTVLLAQDIADALIALQEIVGALPFHYHCIVAKVGGFLQRRDLIRSKQMYVPDNTRSLTK